MPAARASAPHSSPSAATDGPSCRRAATSTCSCSCRVPRPLRRPRRSPRRSGTRSGTRGCVSTTRCVRRPRRAASPATTCGSLLGLLDLRHVAGDESLSATLREAVLADWRGFARRRLPELFASCAERAERAGDLAFSLEPDLKESRGGLRDLVALRAVAASWVADVRHEGLDEARQSLLDVRDALHDVTGRATDRLVLQDQEAVAKRVGLLDDDALLRQVSGVGRSVAYTLDDAAFRVERTLSSRRDLRSPGPAPARHPGAARRRRGRAGRRGGPGPGRQPGRRPHPAAARRRCGRAGRAAACPAHRAPAGGRERRAARTLAASRARRPPQPARRRPAGRRRSGRRWTRPG